MILPLVRHMTVLDSSSVSERSPGMGSHRRLTFGSSVTKFLTEIFEEGSWVINISITYTKLENIVIFVPHALKSGLLLLAQYCV